MENDSPEQTQPRTTGPLPHFHTRMTAVMLEDDIIEWGKRQPGGLSATVRRLLRAAMEQENRQGNSL